MSELANRFKGLTKHIPPGQFARYLIVGGANTLFGYGTFALLTALLTGVIPYAYVLASVVSSVINITVSYLNYKRFVFKTKGNYLREWLRCVAVYSGGIAISAALLPVLVLAIKRGTRLDSAAPYVAGALLMGLQTIYSFIGHKKFSFRPQNE
jgi:putative flippase GtrA